jgi:hypothetical protein
MSSPARLLLVYGPPTRQPHGRLLDELCTTHGWCLSEEHRNTLVAGAHDDRDTIAAAIVQAEFGQADAEREAWLAPIVDDWLFDPAGRGARSGLPR